MRPKPRSTSAQPGELVLLQADTIDETVHWLRGYLEALAAKTAPEVIEVVLGEPAEEPCCGGRRRGGRGHRARRGRERHSGRGPRRGQGMTDTPS